MEVATRAIRGWHLRRHLAQPRPVPAWRRAPGPGQPDRHYADQSVQDAATAASQRRHARGVHISLATMGEATANGEAERLRRTRQAAAVARHDEAACHTADHRRGRCRDAGDQHQRMPSALDYVTPAEFDVHGRP